MYLTDSAMPEYIEIYHFILYVECMAFTCVQFTKLKLKYNIVSQIEVLIMF